MISPTATMFIKSFLSFSSGCGSSIFLSESSFSLEEILSKFSFFSQENSHKRTAQKIIFLFTFNPLNKEAKIQNSSKKIVDV